MSISLLKALFLKQHVHVLQEHCENLLPNRGGDLELAASSSGPSGEKCASAHPPENADAEKKLKRGRD